MEIRNNSLVKKLNLPSETKISDMGQTSLSLFVNLYFLYAHTFSKWKSLFTVFLLSVILKLFITNFLFQFCQGISVLTQSFVLSFCPSWSMCYLRLPHAPQVCTKVTLIPHVTGNPLNTIYMARLSLITPWLDCFSAGFSYGATSK